MLIEFKATQVYTLYAYICIQDVLLPSELRFRHVFYLAYSVYRLESASWDLDRTEHLP